MCLLLVAVWIITDGNQTRCRNFHLRQCTLFMGHSHSGTTSLQGALFLVSSHSSSPSSCPPAVVALSPTSVVWVDDGARDRVISFEIFLSPDLPRMITERSSLPKLSLNLLPLLLPPTSPSDFRLLPEVYSPKSNSCVSPSTP